MPKPLDVVGTLGSCGYQIVDLSSDAARCHYYFARLIDPLRAIARSHGYALATHGSLARDIDLIAAPWVENVSEPQMLAEAIRAEVERIIGHAFLDAYVFPLRKPHGRLCWSFHLGGGPYIDLSVMVGRCA